LFGWKENEQKKSDVQAHPVPEKNSLLPSESGVGCRWLFLQTDNHPLTGAQKFLLQQYPQEF